MSAETISDRAKAEEWELLIRSLFDDATSCATFPSPSTKSSQHEHDLLKPPPNSPSGLTSDHQSADLTPFPNISLDKNVRDLGSASLHPNLANPAEPDRYSDIASERQAHHASGINVDPGSKRTAQRSHSRDVRAASLAKGKGEEGEGEQCQHPKCRQRREEGEAYETMVKSGVISVSEEVRKKNRGAHRDSAAIRSEDEGDEATRLNQGHFSGNSDGVSNTAASSQPDTTPENQSIDQGKREKPGHPQSQPQQHVHFSGPGSHLSSRTFRGGDIASPAYGASSPPSFSGPRSHLSVGTLRDVADEGKSSAASNSENKTSSSSNDRADGDALA